MIAVPLVAGAALLQWLSQDVPGKSVLIVGPRLSGKTVLRGLLASGDRSLKEIDNPADTFNFSEKRFSMTDLPWRITVVDSPFTKGGDHEMREQVQKANLVVFTVDSSRPVDDDPADCAKPRHDLSPLRY